MTPLRGIRKDDIVEVDGDAYCRVVGKEGRELQLVSLTGKWHPPTVTAKRVTDHWRHVNPRGKRRKDAPASHE